MLRAVAAGLLFVSAAEAFVRAEAPFHSAEAIFPPRSDHNHAPGIAELPSGELVVSWYRGSGERSADDVAVYGARKPVGAKAWTPAEVWADTPGFPDCNTCLHVDADGRLHLFWPVILANSWESCVTRHRAGVFAAADGRPQWTIDEFLLLQPADFHEEFEHDVAQALQALTAQGQVIPAALQAEIDDAVRKSADKLSQRLGWQPRCKPTRLPSGRLLLPLYSDTFSISMMAISDDGGASWFAGRPLMGVGAIQPSVLRRDDGRLAAFMRENGPRGRIRVCESSDDGVSWGPVSESELPNPGSGLDGVRLANGRWVLVYNDSTHGRNSLAVSLSEDEGRTWRWTRHLERRDKGSFHYPAVIQTRDGQLHCVYSTFTDEGKTMTHAEFNEVWIRDGEAPREPVSAHRPR